MKRFDVSGPVGVQRVQRNGKWAIVDVWLVVCTKCKLAGLRHQEKLPTNTTECWRCDRRSGSVNRRWESGYGSYRAMIQRTTVPTHKDYVRYGAVGVKVCDRWRYGESGRSGFACFKADMGLKPSKSHTLHRIGGAMLYSPLTCKWADYQEQNADSGVPRLLTLNGETKTLSAWANSLDITPTTLCGRLRRGWDLERALTASRINVGRKKGPETQKPGHGV